MIPGVSDERISAEEAYEMAQLHARAMRAFESANWPIGSTYEILVGRRRISRRERRERGISDRSEGVYITEHAITVFPARLMTRSGACYQADYVGSPSGMVGLNRYLPVTWATITRGDDVRYWKDAFYDVIERFEQPRHAISSTPTDWPLLGNTTSTDELAGAR